MTPEERKMLEEALRLSRETHTMMRKLHRATLIGYFFKVLYVAVIILIVVGSYYLTLPYINQLKSLYTNVESTVGKVQGGLGGVSDLLGGLKQ